MLNLQNQMRRSVCVVCIVASLAVQASAQSLSFIKSLIADGEYLKAAQLLRPKADGGDAEAQLIAAQLFFEGKGVDYSEAQGVKYATLSADQGNMEALQLVVDHYRKKGQPAKAVAFLEDQFERHPYLKEKPIYKTFGLLLLDDPDTEDLGWNILGRNFSLSEQNGLVGRYFDWRVRSFGVPDRESLLEVLCRTHQSWEFEIRKLADYIVTEDMGGRSAATTKFRQRAAQGDGFAMAGLGWLFVTSSNLRERVEVKGWAAKAAAAGSAWGTWLNRRYANTAYYDADHLSVGGYQDDRMSVTGLLICGDETTLYLHFANTHDTWMRPDWKEYLLCGGKRLRMTGNSLKQNIHLNFGQGCSFNVTFEALPEGWTSFNYMNSDGSVFIQNIRRK